MERSRTSHLTMTNGIAVTEDAHSTYRTGSTFMVSWKRALPVFWRMQNSLETVHHVEGVVYREFLDDLGIITIRKGAYSDSWIMIPEENIRFIADKMKSLKNSFFLYKRKKFQTYKYLLEMLGIIKNRRLVRI